MSDQESLKTLEEEIAELERKLAEKKSAVSHTETQPEKELFREVLREHVEQVKDMSSSMPPVSPRDNAVMAAPSAYDGTEEAHRDQVDALVEIAVTKGIAHAVDTARQTGNFHLLDDFHDALADDYYEAVVNSRAISSS